MRRFFVEPDAVQGDLATLGGGEARHLATVLRLAPGTEVELFDGTGLLYLGRVNAVSRNTVTVCILSSERLPAPGPALTLVQGLLKGKKMDFLVQKATELGVHTLQPLICRYSDRQGVTAAQLERWQRIMLEACKQCRRVVPMTIAKPGVATELDFTDSTGRILFWEGEQCRPISADLLPQDGPTCLVFGPEGGWHDDEVAWFRGAGFRTVSLGHRILRAETAALAGTAIVRFLSGGLHPDP